MWIRVALVLCCLCAAPVARAEGLRLAWYDTELARDGPGLLLRDLLKGGDPQIGAVQAVIADLDADVLLLGGVDYDADLLAARALNAGLPHPYPHVFAWRSNAGWPTGLDLDGNGRRGEARDAQGYGRFSGQGALVLLSRLPLAEGGRDFSGLLWGALPGSLMAPDDPGAGVQRLASTGHWLVPLSAAEGLLWLGGFKATPPVFDGPEDRNGRRNHDEILFWRHLLDGAFGAPPGRLVLLGGANLDPRRGEGRHAAIRTLLEDPRLQDPLAMVGLGDRPTVDWAGTEDMRVDYLLVSTGVPVRAAGVLDRPRPLLTRASRHFPVWADLEGRWTAPSEAEGDGTAARP
ncbi:endonuclease/exonuclease/phosphatase family protein [Pseudooceanicola sp. CBS1P-1]|uniref:Endonuclease/exonuclease/phosphatase family protein n=1 Tax=Pseudooceanicola albus TaxID=2692189 RepID=A0A6L7GCF3_9RHOB|nr:MULTISPECIES: endonuclease/exonuclease/phosphatase family protein [Pseudooceanicola]MBT9386350.1 endonuclease/exonuclease/phosphatase family protein [Pseudooceanicola endophyticus]MXN20493.1 endonuclease/exonuclease/phosphatase family protein [Pseudooceanicola albus]